MARWITITHDELEHARRWFERHGTMAVLFGRMVPAVRTVISVPAGVTQMPLWRFLLWSTIGSALWSGLLAAFGRLLGARYDQVVEWMNPDHERDRRSGAGDLCLACGDLPQVGIAGSLIDVVRRGCAGGNHVSWRSATANPRATPGRAISAAYQRSTWVKSARST